MNPIQIILRAWASWCLLGCAISLVLNVGLASDPDRPEVRKSAPPGLAVFSDKKPPSDAQEKTPEELAVEAKLVEATKQFSEKIRPSLEKYCYECHGPADPQGGLNLVSIADYSQVKASEQTWTSVMERVQADEMPPQGSKEMDFGDRQQLIRWAGEHQAKDVDCTKLASDRTVNFYLGSVMSRRLNRAEYNNTLSDLFGLPVHVGDRLPADAAGGGGFDTTGDTLFTSSLSIEKFIEAAEELLNEILPDDPTQQDEQFKQARERLLALGQTDEATNTAPDDASSDEARARRILSRLMRIAFRRSVSNEDIDRFLVIFQHAYNRGDGFDASLRLSITGILLSPHFLFLVEPESEQGDIQPLGPFALASRLSYFLWASMPDETLLQAAETGQLLDNEVYLAQVRRMMKDPKIQSLGNRFAAQWLEIDKLGADVRPDAGRFPEFDDQLAESMKQEVILFFNYLVQEDRTLLDLLDSDYSFLDDRLQSLYGIKNGAADGQGAGQQDQFRLVKFKDSSRGGVTGMAAIHALTSFPLRTSPVLRGRYVLEVLLGERVPPPPPNIPPLETDDHQADAANIREQLERHRKEATCSACHQRMDPLGFSMESFDNLGRLRSQSNGKPIDVSAQLPDGFAFEGPIGLKQVLVNRKHQIMSHLTKRLVGYALGRELNRFDDCVIRDSMKALEAHEYRPSVLVETIATSLPFKYRYYPK